MESSIKNLQISFPQPKLVDNSTKELQGEQKNSFQKLFDERKQEITKGTQNQDVKANKTDGNDADDEKKTIIDVTDSKPSLDLAKCVFFMNVQNTEPVLLQGAADKTVDNTAITQAQIVEIPKEKNEMASNTLIQSNGIPKESIQKEFTVPLLDEEVPKKNSIDLKEGKALAEITDNPVKGNVNSSQLQTETVESKETVDSIETSINTADKEKGLNTIQHPVQDDANTGTVEHMMGSLQTETKVNSINEAGKNDAVIVSVNQPEELPQKIVDTLNYKMATREKEFEIQIEPYNLGKIAIKVAYEQNGTTISIMCSNTKTMDILAQNAKSIGSIMETNMGSPTVIFVEKNEEHYLNQDHSSQGGQEHRQQSENHSRSKDEQESNGLDFIQQLRLGLVSN